MEKVFFNSIKRTNPKILALAKNYVPPGSKDIPSQPLIFTKPASSLLYKGESLILHTKSQINYEIELGVMIGKSGKNISKEEALQHIGGYFLCLDMTDWGNITASRAAGAPWDIGKGQDGFLPISDFITKEKITDPQNVDLSLTINQKPEVNDSTKNMFYKVDYIIQYISKYMTLNEGDLILTGTPKLAPVFNGDKLDAQLAFNGTKLASISLDIINSP